MTETLVLTTITVAQCVFFVLLVVLMLANRARLDGQKRRDAALAANANEPLRHWLVGMGSAVRVGTAFRKLPPDLAREQLVLIAARLAPSHLVELTRVMRSESWVVRTVARARSIFWWRRLEAARLLAVVAAPRDRMTVRRLLADPHPAVESAATSCLTRLDDEGLVADVIERMPDRAPAVRLSQADVIRRVWQLASRPLLRRLQMRAPAKRLQVWIELAEMIGEPQCLAAVIALHRHPDAGVRATVARALRRFPHPTSASALAERIADPEWRVRAEAARSLGAVVSTEAIPLLVGSLSDRAWAVRLRAALALAEMGPSGREALAAVAKRNDDQFARDMAIMVSVLSDGTIAELGAA